ncbi:MAG: T9SS type A sorting domain-containing protein [Ignavibacteriae bacterium]|nr:T9SS type A sorting domain-containing protein [Ignavibacteriota bacterium]
MKRKTLLIVLALFLNSSFLINNCVSQWVQISNGMGNNKDVRALAVSGTNIFAGTNASGVFLSTNYGTDWIAVNNGLTNLNVNAIAISGTNLFAGTDGGVFLSTNNGNTWIAVNNGLTNLYVNGLTVSGINLFAATDGGAFLSTNNGTNWTSINNGLTDPLVYFIAVTGTKLFAGTHTKLFLSSNNGITWSRVINGLPNSNEFVAFAVFGTNYFTGTGNRGVFLSTNSGTIWDSVNNGLTYNSVVWSLAVSGTNLFAGTLVGVFLSTNNGTSWINKNQGFNTIPNVAALLISNNYIFAGTQGQSVFRRSQTEAIGIKNIGTEIPAKYSLSQNYPNPFNPTTKIRFDVINGFPVGTSGNDKVVLKVYDIQGREVQTLVNESLKPGTYEVSFDGSRLNSGVYFYKLITNGYSETRKMLMIK